MNAAALRHHLASLHPLELKELEEPYRRFDIDRMAEHFGVTPDAIWAEIKRLKPKASTDRYDWLKAINRAAGRQQITQKALAVAVALFDYFNDRSEYAWPNQQTIAAACGWNQTRGVREGLAKLEEIGAVTRLQACNLPIEVKAQVFGAKAEGGSGRDIRAVAYRRNDPSLWQSSNSGTDHSGNKRNGSFRLNPEVKPQPASPEYFTHEIGDSIDKPEYQETLIRATDERVTIGGAAP